MEGLGRRFKLLGVDSPVMAIADNCCQVSAAVKKFFPDIDMCLDVWHFMMR